ncbi:hypothetical protein GUITHDRAFT_107025 [Guillardia theta CCMP2712]|uniref:Uncharacterized protein n=1 Tax=Guillardia theta (strain CCMP2712) TaxID=905079 RepID=L1JFK7_GUITC|nr:hypothetical protein GUITHDRAFT_107025 [Guillardia theta CCMP2712]EKX47112.1 hypothetical protein GUITHDRAFT_107025 [Guillardia theta CCMP2712]|eukprot:XP_005834092.1 hypothetical protein GUITHDRAFT_107025 [Guillardia theta CCMP2712]
MLVCAHQLRWFALLAILGCALPESCSQRRGAVPRPNKEGRLGFEEIVFKKVYSRADTPKTPSKSNRTRLARTPRGRGKREEASEASGRETTLEAVKPAAAASNASSKTGSRTVKFVNVSKGSRSHGASARKAKKESKRLRSENSQMNSESNLMLSEAETDYKSEFTDVEDSQQVYDSCRDPEVDRIFPPLHNQTGGAKGISVKWDVPNSTIMQDDTMNHEGSEGVDDGSFAPSTADPSDDELVSNAPGLDEECPQEEVPSQPSGLTRMGLGILRLIRTSVLGELSPIKEAKAENVNDSHATIKVFVSRPSEDSPHALSPLMPSQQLGPENVTKNQFALPTVGGLFHNIVSYLAKNNTESRKQLVVHETARGAQEKKIVEKVELEEPSYITVKIKDECKDDKEPSELKIFPIRENKAARTKRNVKCVVDEGVPGTPFGSKIVRVVGVRPTTYRLYQDNEDRRRESERENERKQAFKMFGGISKKARFSKPKKTGISWFWGSQTQDKAAKSKYNYSNMLKGSIRSSSNAKRGAVYNSKIWERPQSAVNMSPVGSSFKQQVLEAQDTLGFNPLMSQAKELPVGSARESLKKGSSFLNESPGAESKLLGQNKIARAEMLGF